MASAPTPDTSPHKPREAAVRRSSVRTFLYKFACEYDIDLGLEAMPGDIVLLADALLREGRTAPKDIAADTHGTGVWAFAIRDTLLPADFLAAVLERARKLVIHMTRMLRMT